MPGSAEVGLPASEPLKSSCLCISAAKELVERVLEGSSNVRLASPLVCVCVCGGGVNRHSELE